MENKLSLHHNNVFMQMFTFMHDFKYEIMLEFHVWIYLWILCLNLSMNFTFEFTYEFHVCIYVGSLVLIFVFVYILIEAVNKFVVLKINWNIDCVLADFIGLLWEWEQKGVCMRESEWVGVSERWSLVCLIN